MREEHVVISADGGEITAFEDIEVTAGFNEVARSFKLEVAAEGGEAQTAKRFIAGTKVTISSNGDLMFTGYVDRYQPHLSRKKAIITVSGRGKGQDWVDCSAETDGGRLVNLTLLEIAKKLDKFGVGVTSTAKLEPIPEYQITQGETVFRLLDRLARTQNVTMTGKADGSVLIASGSDGANGQLLEGLNIQELKVDHNWTTRHSIVKVYGQAPDGVGIGNTQLEGYAEDTAIERYRPIVIVHDDDADKKRVQKRAKQRLDREAGRALQAEIDVQSFHDEDGKLWGPGAIVWVQSDFAALAQNMLIERCVWKQRRKTGSITTLHLVDPQAYEAPPSQSNESGPQWESTTKTPLEGYE